MKSMNQLCRRLVVGLLLLASHSAQAGMPSFTLNEVVRFRLEDISFFLLLLLLSALGMKLLWNYVFTGMSRIPRLTYWRALGLNFILGLMMLLVLSMISGARELLTPGAWRKQGISHRLNSSLTDEVRIRQLEFLRSALTDYTNTHAGKFPGHDWVPEIPEKLWQADEQGTRFIYIPGFFPSNTKDILVSEPAVFGDQRYVLYRTGEIKKLSTSDINTALGMTRRQ